jgi:hypothetical protein
MALMNPPWMKPSPDQYAASGILPDGATLPYRCVQDDTAWHWLLGYAGTYGILLPEASDGSS